jgi:hypothetical protein
VLKAPTVPAASFEQRWGAWGGVYGGSNRTFGDPAVIGSHDLSAPTAGFAGVAGLGVAADNAYMEMLRPSAGCRNLEAASYNDMRILLNKLRWRSNTSRRFDPIDVRVVCGFAPGRSAG